MKKILVALTALGLGACGDQSARQNKQPLAQPQPSQSPKPVPAALVAPQPEPQAVHTISYSKADYGSKEWQYIEVPDAMRDTPQFQAFIVGRAKGKRAALRLAPAKTVPGALFVMLYDHACVPKEDCLGSMRIDQDPVVDLVMHVYPADHNILQIDYGSKLVGRLRQARQIYIELPMRSAGYRQFKFTPTKELVWPIKKA